MGEHSVRANELILGSLRNRVRALAPDALSDVDALAAFDWFAQVERLAAAGKAILAGRAVRTEARVRSGERSDEAWLAKRADITIGEARALLGVAARIDAAPATNEAFRNGALSVAKADAVTSAVVVAPDAEARLLDVAAHGSLKRVRDDANRVRAAADPDPEATHARIHKTRGWRRWTDADGSRCGTYRLTPEDGALFEAAAQPFVDAAVDAARQEGSDDSYEALLADGLVGMAKHVLDDDSEHAGERDDASDIDAGAPKARGPRGRKRFGNRRELIGVVDLSDWLDAIDAVENGAETVDIIGVGPIPLSIARQLFGDALLQIVIRRGVDICTVVHTGRTASAIQETALLVLQNGRCGIPYCHRPPAETDHRQGFTITGAVTLADLLGICGHHHDQKTNHGYTWRREPDGTITWIHPDGTEEHEPRPPP